LKNLDLKIEEPDLKCEWGPGTRFIALLSDRLLGASAGSLEDLRSIQGYVKDVLVLQDWTVAAR